MAVLFSRGKRQEGNSGFFGRLPIEIRHMIYDELFGHRMIHIMYYNVVDANKTRRQNRPRARIPGLVNCVCRRPPDTQPHEHRERDHKWCYVSANFLRTCKQAFEEGMPMLYGSNKFMFHKNIDFVQFITTIERYRKIIRSMDFYTDRSLIGVDHLYELLNHLVCFPFTGSRISVRIHLDSSRVSKPQFKKIMMSIIRNYESGGGVTRLSHLVNLTFMLPSGHIGQLQTGLRRAGYNHISEIAWEEFPDDGRIYGEDSDDENHGYMLF